MPEPTVDYSDLETVQRIAIDRGDKLIEANNRILELEAELADARRIISCLFTSEDLERAAMMMQEAASLPPWLGFGHSSDA